MNTKKNLFFCCFTAKMLIISLQFDLYPETSLPKKKSFFCGKAITTRRCSAKVSADIKAYQPIPIITDSTNEDGSDNLRETIEANYRKVKQEILSLVDSEIERIKNDSSLQHLIKE